MTYCVGMLVAEGLVMMADTRTNAGVDNISTYRKLRIMDTAPDRVMVISSAGNLSVTQATVNRVLEGRLIPAMTPKPAKRSIPCLACSAPPS